MNGKFSAGNNSVGNKSAFIGQKNECMRAND